MQGAGTTRRSNLRWAVFLAGVVAALWFLALPVLDLLGSDEEWNRPALAVTVVAIVLAPVALVWLVAEAHLRWSPRERRRRAVVGWLLALGTIALLACVAPVAAYIVLMSLAVLFGW